MREGVWNLLVKATTLVTIGINIADLFDLFVEFICPIKQIDTYTEATKLISIKIKM